MDQIKVGVGLWCVSFAADRFLSSGYRDPVSLEEQIKMVARIDGAESVDLHTSDFQGISPKEVVKMVQDHGLKVNAVNANIFGTQEFKYGAYTNTDPNIRRKAIDLSKKSIDMAQEMRANISSLWPGQDGFDYEYKPREPRMYSLVSDAAGVMEMLRKKVLLTR